MGTTGQLTRIAVGVADTPVTKALVGWAGSMAVAVEAQLTGVAAARPFIPSYSPLGSELLNYQPGVLEAARRQVEAALNKAQQVFTNALPAAATKTAWRASTADTPVAFLLQQGSGHDALVLPRQGAADAREFLLSVDPKDVVLEAGRPVIVVPPDAKTFDPSRLFIAWKPGPHARRAVVDALPYLPLAREVFICCIGEEKTLAPEADNVVRFLEGHGAVAEPAFESAGGRTDSAALLDVARRVSATFLVAGAYGQSRLREWAFGGVTRDLLDHAPLPCLFSH